MTRQEFIDILDKEGVAYRIDVKGAIFVDGSYVLGSSLAYIYPNYGISCGFDTQDQLRPTLKTSSRRTWCQ